MAYNIFPDYQRKQEAISKLREIATKARELLPEQFNYSDYVTTFDREHKCGTCCCIIGWFPIWFPDSGIYYLANSIGYKDKAEWQYLNISQSITSLLFYSVTMNNLCFAIKRVLKEHDLDLSDCMGPLFNAYSRGLKSESIEPEILAKCIDNVTKELEKF